MRDVMIEVVGGIYNNLIGPSVIQKTTEILVLLWGGIDVDVFRGSDITFHPLF